VLGLRSSGFGLVLATTKLSALRSGIVLARVFCPRRSGGCRGTIVLRTARAVRLTPRSRRPVVLTLASASFEVPAGHSRTVVLHLLRSVLSVLARARTMPLQVAIATRDATGARLVGHTRATLRSPGRFG
jgi:hypothetical protein